MPTKQEIIDRRQEIHASGVGSARAERKAYEARTAAEMQSLRELCGSTGHVFGDIDGALSFYQHRACVFCRQPEGA